MLQFFDGLKAEDLPDGQGWAVEQVSLSTHNGTHLDAPWHFHPTMNRGERVLDHRRGAAGMVLPARREARLPALAGRLCRNGKDVEAELKRIGHTLSPLEIVVVNTSAGANMAGRTTSRRLRHGL
jgi:hypothetical protein